MGRRGRKGAARCLPKPACTWGGKGAAEAGTAHSELRTTRHAGPHGGGSKEGMLISLDSPRPTQGHREKSQRDRNTNPHCSQHEAHSWLAIKHCFLSGQPKLWFSSRGDGPGGTTAPSPGLHPPPTSHIEFSTLRPERMEHPGAVLCQLPEVPASPHITPVPPGGSPHSRQPGAGAESRVSI